MFSGQRRSVQGKFIFHDENEQFFEDNAERMVFFCKAVLETVKSFNGTGYHPLPRLDDPLIPLYLKTAYKNEPVFDNAKVVFSMYHNAIDEKLANTFMERLRSRIPFLQKIWKPSKDWTSPA
ncbi:MAG: glycogen/starch synthase [Chitinophagales bacterium]|nr:glycogen/starch synthase [Chitinophagales bacterium]